VQCCSLRKPELTSNGKSAAQNRWIAYNKLRGQYASAMEHAVPEQFWVDKSQCRYENEQGQIQKPTQADCAQAVSAVKAIAIAQAEGQRIYTINHSNAATALPKLPVGGTVGQEIRSAIDAGKEVTFHESGINAHGFSGYGYVITDPETGAGAYLIEGKGNGGVYFGIGIAVGSVIGVTMFLIGAAMAGGASSDKFVAPLVQALLIELIAVAAIYQAYKFLYPDLAAGCFLTGVGIGIASGTFVATGLGRGAPSSHGVSTVMSAISLAISVAFGYGSTEPIDKCTK